MADYLGYNLNPTPQAGQGAYGKVAGSTGVPPSIWQEILAANPDMAGLMSQAGGAIKSELAGQVSPQTMGLLQNQAASRGVSLGQPNSDISNMIGLNLLGTTSEGLQKQGLTDYNTFLSGMGSTQIDPRLTSDIAQQNALLASAPDPEKAAQKQLELYNLYFSKMNTPAAGTGGYGGGITYNPAGNIGFGYGPSFGSGVGFGSNYGSNPLGGIGGGSRYTTYG
jgi:hypothetical protein